MDVFQVNPYLNAITADRFEEALKEAKEIDKQIALGASDELLKKPFLGKIKKNTFYLKILSMYKF